MAEGREHEYGPECQRECRALTELIRTVDTHTVLNSHRLKVVEDIVAKLADFQVAMRTFMDKMAGAEETKKDQHTANKWRLNIIIAILAALAAYIGLVRGCGPVSVPIVTHSQGVISIQPQDAGIPRNP